MDASIIDVPAVVRREDALQAVIAALSFGENAGLAGMAWWEGREPDGSRDDVTLHPGGGADARVSFGAADLLASAWMFVTSSRGLCHTTSPRGISHYDLVRTVGAVPRG